MNVADAHERTEAVIEELLGAIVVDRAFLETLVTGVLARGHVLLEDVPGTGKTLTARSLAAVLGLEFSRVQFTPDLLPADVTGTNVFNERDGSFEFSPGPIFANVVLADEINRAPPKTQAALLEAMEERQVTVGGDTHPLPRPFFVIATQNPVEQEGTFALPEAQIDRFALKSQIGYPDTAGEIELLRRRVGRATQSPGVERVLDPAGVKQLREVPESIRVDPDLLEYIATVARATRDQPEVAVGVSPRGTQRVLEAARAHATVQDRQFVTPEDIATVLQPAMAHRLVLTPESSVERASKAAIVERIQAETPVPTIEQLGPD
jgi:MoxR-like ATPases